MTSAKSSPEKLGAAAKATGTGMRKLTNISKQCAGLTIDTAVQQEYLSTALAYYLLEMLTAAKNESIFVILLLCPSFLVFDIRFNILSLTYRHE